MKIFGYLIFSAFYYIFSLFPIVKNKVFCIMTHDGNDDGNVMSVVKYLEKLDRGFTFRFIKKEETNDMRSMKIKRFIDFFIVKPYELVTSEYIIQDNIFLPFAFISFSKKVKVIQLWHGTGTIKKFGQDANEGQLKWLEKRANKTITHLIVNSRVTKSIYKGAFGIDESKIFVYGSPRTDILFNDSLSEHIEEFYHEYEDLRNKKLILYMPTFRDNEVKNPSLKLDINNMIKSLSEDYVIGLKFHPFVADNFVFDDRYGGRVINLSRYGNITALLGVSHTLITDYSSVIFEYCILNKPMIFFPYDFNSFSDYGRGFYNDYFSNLPGEAVTDTDEIIRIIKEDKDHIPKVEEFTKLYYEYTDGNSTKRLVDKVF